MVRMSRTSGTLSSATGWSATTSSTPSKRVKAASCSTAPARRPSAVTTVGVTPAITNRVASRTAVSVFPAPGGPAK